jgi:sterol desaturase/sphingolipid hydroxylase (fatty acid hydroxylase superfamily)
VLALPAVAALVPGFGLWPIDTPPWLQLALAIAVADFGITLAHMASHRFELLWRFHAVHHSVERMYGFNGLMKHPLHQAFETVCGTTPLLLLGMPENVAWLLAFAVAIQLLLQHSNVDVRIGPWVRVWALAPAHRFHHVNRTPEGDVNFGLFTTVWDHVFGTFRYDAKQAFAIGDLGVEGRADYPRGYFAQMVAPLRAQ